MKRREAARPMGSRVYMYIGQTLSLPMVWCLQTASDENRRKYARARAARAPGRGPIKTENLKVGGIPKYHRKSSDLNEWNNFVKGTNFWRGIFLL